MSLTLLILIQVLAMLWMIQVATLTALVAVRVATTIPSVTLPLKTMHPVLRMIQGAISTILVTTKAVISY